MATSAAHRTTPSYGHTYRHHPYAPPCSSRDASNGTTPRYPPQQQSASASAPGSPQEDRRGRRKHEHLKHLDASACPLDLGVAFGQSAGGKWWDDELPAPPSSLTSILESFRKSGEGDRELLLSILGAKKAEEERLTWLIQTRLTILQARLALHTSAAQLNSVAPPPPPVASAPMIERTPSLGASSRGSASSTGPVSPMGTVYATLPAPAKPASYFYLPPPSSLVRRAASSSPDHRDSNRLPPVRGSLSPTSPASDGSRAPGLDMLLDAGMEREKRDSDSL